MKKQLSMSEMNRNYCYMSHNFATQTEWIKAIIISKKKGVTIGELSELTGLPKSTISARIGDLKGNLIALKSKLDINTNTRVTVWLWSNDNNHITKVTNMDKIKAIEELCLKSQTILASQILKVLY